MLENIRTLVVGTLAKRDGITAMEYAVIAGVVGAALVAAFTAFYDRISTSLGAVKFN